MSWRFLTAEWRHLVMLSFRIDPVVLTPLVPGGTELDFHQGECYVSLVGFRFLRTKVLGIPVLGHRDFDEVNLRFYVRRQVGGELRRGVVFIREIVPRRCVTWIANWVYHENYVTCPMQSRQVFEAAGATAPAATLETSERRHSSSELHFSSSAYDSSSSSLLASGQRQQQTLSNEAGGVSPPGRAEWAGQQAATEGTRDGARRAEGDWPGGRNFSGSNWDTPATGDLRTWEYAWQQGARTFRLGAECRGGLTLPAVGSVEEFITEHYWGYVRKRDGSTMEYLVEHPPWGVRRADKVTWEGDIAGFYGSPFASALSQPAASSLLTEGSAIVVYRGTPVFL